MSSFRYLSFFFFNDTATTEIYTLSLHDALPISIDHKVIAKQFLWAGLLFLLLGGTLAMLIRWQWRSEEHTSELQSRGHLVCRLLLEKKKKKHKTRPDSLK